MFVLMGLGFFRFKIFVASFKTRLYLIESLWFLVLLRFPVSYDVLVGRNSVPVEVNMKLQKVDAVQP